MLLETIRIEHGQPQNLCWHQARFDRSREAIFGRGLPKILLKNELAATAPPAPEDIFKCRILYEKQIQSIDFHRYTPRRITSLQLLEIGDFDYSLKWADRRQLDQFFAKRGTADDVLLIKNGRVTDTSYANVALWDGSRWLTPDSPLLAGTCRARLIFFKKIVLASISVEQVFDFEKLRIFNSMLGWQGGADVPTSQISPC